jgi:hypothetical protein
LWNLAGLLLLVDSGADAPMARLMTTGFFSGAKAAIDSSLGSSMLIDSRSAQRPASSISSGLASGITFR